MATLEHNHFVWDNETPRETTRNSVIQEKIYDKAQALGLETTYQCADMEAWELLISGPRHLILEVMHYGDVEGALFSTVSVDSEEDYEFFEIHEGDCVEEVIYGG